MYYFHEMFFLTDVYRYLKLGLASICLLFGVIVMVYGFADSTNIPVVAGGIILLLASIFLFIDGSKILRDLRKEVGRLSKERKEFDEENKELQKNNEELEATVDEGKKQLRERGKQIKEQKKLVEEEKKSVQAQKDIVAKQQKQLDEQKANVQTLTAQIAKFQQLNSNMKTIILTMAQTMDQSNKLADALGQSIARIENASNDILQSAEIMERLQTGLKKLKFSQLDLNQDGSISRIEWNQAISQLK